EERARTGGASSGIIGGSGEAVGCDGAVLTQDDTGGFARTSQVWPGGLNLPRQLSGCEARAYGRSLLRVETPRPNLRRGGKAGASGAGLRLRTRRRLKTRED